MNILNKGFLSLSLRCCCFAVVIYFSHFKAIKAQDRISAERLGGEIIFDGICDEDAWYSIRELPLITFSPDYGAEPSEKTIIKIAYDDEYLYLGAILSDKNPDKMKVQIKRDHWNYDCDWIILILDTFNDKENTLAFGTSPNGGRSDVAFYNDGRNQNLDWNTFWDAKASINENGWQAEMRIPFSSLRFHVVDNEVIMGLGIMRYISNKYEAYVMPQAKEEYGFFGPFMATQTTEMVLNGIKSKNPVYITPFISGGLSQTSHLDDIETSYTKESDKNIDAGLDVKFRISDNLTVDVSLNTDFAQVEDDNIRVNLTRFPLFYSEKRQFFQERNSNFLFNFLGNNRLFHSRQIGLYNGLPVDVYGGARVVGMTGDWDVGFLSMQTAPAEDLLSENFSVFRLSRQVINEESELGGIITNRTDFKGKHNTAFGFDGFFHLTGNDYLKLMWAQTYENGNENVFSVNQSQILINWNRRTDKGFYYNMSYNRTGLDYNPAVGFQSRKDYSRFSALMGYGWIYERAWIKKHSISISGDTYLKNTDHYTESSSLALNWSMESRGGITASVSASRSFDYLLNNFSPYPEISIASGKYTDFQIYASTESPRGKSLGIYSEVYSGSYYGGLIYGLSASPTCIIKNTIRFTGTYIFDRVKFPDLEEIFDSHIFRLRTEIVFSTKLSMSAFIQYGNTSKQVPVNVRLRYNPREGNDLYIIYDEGFNTDRSREYPALPFSKLRTIMLKYTYTFIL